MAIVALLFSFLALFAVSSGTALAQCGACTDITFSTSAPDLSCSCPEGDCNCTPAGGLTVTLSSNATCCLDSVVIIPPSGVCWSACMQLAGSMGQIWAPGRNANNVCNSGSGNFFGALGPPSTYLCPNGYTTLYINLCTTSSNIMGFTYKFYWTDGTFCTFTS